MNRGERSGGYTIVETLIFLAVSALMFATAAALIGGQQNRAMFVASVRDFETKITDIANDVSTGYAAGASDVQCARGAQGPIFPGDPAYSIDVQGDCMLVGTVLQFGNEGNRGVMGQVAIAGHRLNSTAEDASSLAEAMPRPIPSSYQPLRILNGSEIRCVFISSSNCAANTTSNAGIGFFTSYSGSKLSGGSIRADTLLMTTLTFNDTQQSRLSNMSNSVVNYGSAVASGNYNPANGIIVCLRSGTTDQYALVRVGGGGSQLTVSSEIRGGNSCNV